MIPIPPWMLTPLFKYGAIAVGALIVVGIVWWQIDSYGDDREKAGRDAVQAEWDKDIAARQKAYIALQDDYRAKEHALAQQVGNIQQEKINAEARTAGLQRRLADSLRKRAERPAGLPDTGAVGADGKDPPKCTGAQLYRDDLQFLQREAEAADGLRHALRACYSQYDAAVVATAR